MSKSDIAVSVRGLSKSYTIAHDAEKHTTAASAYAATLSILVFVGGAFAFKRMERKFADVI